VAKRITEKKTADANTAKAANKPPSAHLEQTADQVPLLNAAARHTRAPTSIMKGCRCARDDAGKAPCWVP